MRELFGICPRNSQVAAQTGPLPPQTTPSADPCLPPHRTRTSGETAPAGVSANTAQGLPCSLMLASCRKYAALRDKTC